MVKRKVKKKILEVTFMPTIIIKHHWMTNWGLALPLLGGDSRHYYYDKKQRKDEELFIMLKQLLKEMT